MPLWVGGAGSSSNTMSFGPRPTSVPSGILVHAAVWPQYTRVTDDRRQTDRQTTSHDNSRTLHCNGRLKMSQHLASIFSTTISPAESWTAVWVLCASLFTQFLSMAFSWSHISQGRVATHLRCGGIFNYHFIAHLSQSLTMQEFWENLLRFDTVDTSSLPCFYVSQCIYMQVSTAFKHQTIAIYVGRCPTWWPPSRI